MILSVIYVNFNTTDVLLESLRSLRAHLGVDHEIIIVDNASEREPLDAKAVAAASPSAKIVWSPKNVGFGQGNNLGAEHASGKYLWILNTDTVLPSDHNIEACLDCLDNRPDCGAALPLVLNPDGTEQQGQDGRFPSAMRIAADKLGVRGALNYTDLAAPRDIEFATGAALIIRTDLFREVGGFTPDFFFFMEDVDLCKKLAATGHKIRHVTDSRIVHIKGASVSNEAWRRRAYYDALDAYFARWHGRVERKIIKAMAAPMRRRYRE